MMGSIVKMAVEVYGGGNRVRWGCTCVRWIAGSGRLDGGVRLFQGAKKRPLSAHGANLTQLMITQNEQDARKKFRYFR